MENTIRTRRKALGISQEELARRCGVSRQTVNAIENNKYDPTLALPSGSRRSWASRWTSSLRPESDRPGARFALARSGFDAAARFSAIERSGAPRETPPAPDAIWNCRPARGSLLREAHMTPRFASRQTEAPALRGPALLFGPGGVRRGWEFFSKSSGGLQTISNPAPYTLYIPPRETENKEDVYL